MNVLESELHRRYILAEIASATSGRVRVKNYKPRFIALGLLVLAGVLVPFVSSARPQQEPTPLAANDPPATDADSAHIVSVGKSTVMLQRGAQNWERRTRSYPQADYGWYPGSHWRLGMGVDPDMPARGTGQVYDVNKSEVRREERSQLEFKTELIQDQRHLDETLGIDAGLSARHRFAVGVVNMSSNLKTRSSLSFDETTVTWVVTARQTLGVEYISNLVPTEEARQLLSSGADGLAAFKKSFGSYYVDAATREASVSAVVKFENVERRERENITARLAAEFKSATTRGRVDVTVERSRALDDLRDRMSVCVVALGGEGLREISPVLPAVGASDVKAIVETLRSYLAGVTWDKAPPLKFHVSPIPEIARSDEEIMDRNNALAELYYAYLDASVRYARASFLIECSSADEKRAAWEAAKTWDFQFMQAVQHEAKLCLEGRPCRLPDSSPSLVVNGEPRGRPLADLAIPNSSFELCVAASKAGLALATGSAATVEAAFRAVGTDEIDAVTEAEELRLDGAINLRPLGSLRALKSLKLCGKALASLATTPTLPGVFSLEIHDTDIVSLDGIAALTELKELTITECPLLRDVSALQRLKNLRKLRVEKCGAVCDGWWNGRTIDLKGLTALEEIEIELNYQWSEREGSRDRISGFRLVDLEGTASTEVQVSGLRLTRHEDSKGEDPNYRLERLDPAESAIVEVRHGGGGRWEQAMVCSLSGPGPYTLGPKALKYTRIETVTMRYKCRRSA